MIINKEKIEELRHFARIFKGVRKFYGLQQSEMATVLEVSQGWISKIESGNLLPDIMIWFRFIKKFEVTDPYCFTHGGVELKNEVLDEKLKDKSKILKKFNLDQVNLFLTVRKIKPIIEVLEKSYNKQFKEFMDAHSIPTEFFVLLNHPLTFELVDLIFGFVRDLKINENTLQLLPFDFSSTIPGDEDSNLESLLNTSIHFNQCMTYQFSKGEYFVLIDEPVINKIKKLKNAELILNYNVIYPYLYLKNSKQIKLKNPIIRQSNKIGEWSVSYAA